MLPPKIVLHPALNNLKQITYIFGRMETSTGLVHFSGHQFAADPNPDRSP